MNNRLQKFDLRTMMLFLTSCCCFLAAMRLHSFGVHWESLVVLGFCTSPFVHQVFNDLADEPVLQEQPVEKERKRADRLP
jgi:hypothetical protein